MSHDDEINDTLKRLFQLDVDAVHAYATAIAQIDDERIKGTLTEFRGDHQRHVADLRAMLERRGAEAPAETPDLKGFLINAMTALRSAKGTEGALKAMHANEELTNKKYEAATVMALPDDVMRLIWRHKDDEERHLLYVTKALDERAWEKAGDGRIAPGPGQPAPQPHL